MPISFKCPACGAPLDYSGGAETTVRCPYCSNVVGVPAELRPAAPASSAALPVAPAVSVGALPMAPDDMRAAIKQLRLARRLERRQARHQARDLRQH